LGVRLKISPHKTVCAKKPDDNMPDGEKNEHLVYRRPMFSQDHRAKE
jgi:hypothetical protein